MHFAKIEAIDDLIHHSPDLFGLQVSDGTFMSMVDIGTIARIARFRYLCQFSCRHHGKAIRLRQAC